MRGLAARCTGETDEPMIFSRQRGVLGTGESSPGPAGVASVSTRATGAQKKRELSTVSRLARAQVVAISTYAL